jgi:hypothetical protein
MAPAAQPLNMLLAISCHRVALRLFLAALRVSSTVVDGVWIGLPLTV